MRNLFLFRTSFLAALVAGTAIFSLPRRADACGGCFHGEPKPTSQTNSVVTDHRMVVALSADTTTLWDQIEYVGDPTEFAWVLPIHGAVTVGIGSNSFIDALDTATAPVVSAPVLKCKAINYGGYDYEGSSNSGCGCGATSDDATSPPPVKNGTVDTGTSVDDTGVVVTGQSVVGPYETVQIHGTDPGSIAGWLRDHKYVIPVEIEPVLKKYVDEGFDFVAVRLRPGEGVRAMRPIRVSWKGASPSLPLRMVAAGVGASVGIKLFVIGDGRWRVKNFATYAIDPGMLSWDFAQGRSTYTTVRSSLASGFSGRAFAMESSLDVSASLIPPPDPVDKEPPVDAGTDATSDVSDASDASEGGSSDADPDAPSADAADTTPPPDTTPVPPPYDAGTPPGFDPTAPDVDIAWGTKSLRRVTRLRADLPSKFLDTDLVLEADEAQNAISNAYVPKKYTNESAICPQGVDDTATTGSPLTDESGAPKAQSCVVSDGALDDARLPALFGAVALLGVLRRNRRRR